MMSTSDELNKLFDFEESNEERIQRRENDTNTGKVVTANDGKDIVKESNRLICSCYTLSEIEQKMMYCFIRHIQRDDNIRRYTISAQEIQNVCGFGATRFHSLIAQAADKLLSRVVTIRAVNKNAWVKTHWLSFIKYADGKITFEFNPYLKEDLLELQNKFTIFDVRLPMRLTGTYTGRLYLLLKQLEHLNSKLHIIMVDELRNIFQLPPSMSTVNKIRTRIIEPSLEQINKETDLSVTYKPLKVGKSIVSFQFVIKQNKKYLQQHDTINVNANENMLNLFTNPEINEKESLINELYDLVKDYGINKNLFENTLKELAGHEKEAVEYAIKIYKSKISKGEIINTPPGYIIGIIQKYDSESAENEANYNPELERLNEDQKINYNKILEKENETVKIAEDYLTEEEISKMSDEEILKHYNNLERLKQNMFKFAIKQRFPERYNNIFEEK